MGGVNNVNKFTTFLRNVNCMGFNHEKCWPYTGASKGNGYGHVNIKGKTMGAHRRSYQLFIGDIPHGLDVCHTCDNRWCVNPDHLYAGTRAQNVADMVSRGRAAGGNRKRLKECHVQEIRQRINAGHTDSKIAKQMGVRGETVRNIRIGKSYVRFG